MNKEIEYTECKYCIYKNFNDDILQCLSSRLSFAFYKVLQEVPIINLSLKSKSCKCFKKGDYYDSV